MVIVEVLKKHLDHELPTWIKDDATFFVTICADPRGQNQLCHSSVGAGILKSIQYYNEHRKWFCHLGLLMPDHTHLLLSFPDLPSFSPVIGDWKRWSTTRYKIQWQENFFDHRLRNDENFGQKADYILENPVRAGLVKEAKNWPYTWISGR
jgi:putative transposase